jgi:hypothetical protein
MTCERAWSLAKESGAACFVCPGDFVIEGNYTLLSVMA